VNSFEPARSPLPADGPAKGPAHRRWHALAFLSLLQLLIAVDVTVVTIALPSIGADLNAPVPSLTWVITGYTVVGGGLLLLGGRLCDLLGRRRMFLTGAALFGVASLAAGLSTDLTTLVLARFAQGAGEALASPAAMSLIALLFPGTRERARALSVWGAVSSSGLVAGVLLSGVLTDLLHWRAIFLVNPPLVLLVIVAAPLLLRRDPAITRGRIDLPGAALLTIAPLALVFGIVAAGEHPWTDPTVAGSIVVALVAFGAFLLVQARTRRPLVHLGFFRHRGRLSANVATALLSAALSTTFFLSTLYLQDVLGFDPLAAALAFLPFCLALLLAVTQVARLIGVLGPARTALLGLAITGAGVAWLARLPVAGDLWIDLVPGMVAVAVGMAVGLIALQNAALTDVTDEDAGVASGVQRCVDQLGGATGLALLVGIAFAAPADASAAAQVEGFRTAFRLALAGLVLAAIAVGVGARRDA
jgi:MFS transporter, DHA2 family, lincomycin resistance protein